MDKIFNFFKRLFGRNAERDRKVALLEENYASLRKRSDELAKANAEREKQYSELYELAKSLKEKDEELLKAVTDLKTISNRTKVDAESPSPQQILAEWLNGEEADNE